MKERLPEYFLFVYKINYTSKIEVKLEFDYSTSDIDEIVLACGEAAKQIKKRYENVELNSIDGIQLIQRYSTSRLSAKTDRSCGGTLNAGYRKIKKGDVIIHKDEKERTDEEIKWLMDHNAEVREETAMEILQTLYDKCYESNSRLPDESIGHITPIDILTLAKNYNVEVKE